MQASLNKQINKWFQSNEHSDRKACGMTKQCKSAQSSKSVITLDDCEDDNIVDSHLAELKKELSKRSWDVDKVARLLSLTYVSRANSLDTKRGCHSRILSTMTNFPCFKQPLYVSVQYIVFVHF